jgi:spermidine synthase
MLLSAVAAVELLAVTNKMSLDLAVVPFLWVLPLCIYLLTFIICFDRPGWYRRSVMIGALAASFVMAAYAKANELALSPYFLIAVYSAVLFAVCMVCHGELYRLKPSADYLTKYYLYIAAGGAAGGAFVSLAAPLLFDSYIELYLAMIISLLLVLRFYGKQIKAAKRMNFLTAVVGIVLVFAVVFEENRSLDDGYLIEAERNFFGVLSIWQQEIDDKQQTKRVMQNGTTFHGLQFISDKKQNLATAYYGPNSGLGRLLQSFEPTRRKIAAVGLGVGTIAAYLKNTDTLRFYEINPLVVKKAKQWFTYLQKASGKVDIKTGDGRVLLAEESKNDYDILVIDAFSSDAIPVHLLTKEAFEVYLENITEKGVIAVHVSTIHLDIQSVVMKAGQFFRLTSRWYVNDENPEAGIYAADWILLSRDETVFELPGLKNADKQFNRNLDEITLWTDDHINLMEVIVSKDYHLR